MNRKTGVLIILFCMAVLSGCWGYTEPEKMLYIHAVGVDYKDGKYEIHAQVIDFANTARSEKPVTEQVQSEVGQATGRTMDEAFFNLYHSMGQKAFWGHLSFLVLSEELLKKGKMNPVIDSLIRFSETRYHILLYSTKDPVKDLLLTTQIINKSIKLSKLSDPRNSFGQESFIEPIDFRTLLIGLNEPGHEVAIPYVTVTENWESLEGKNKVESILGVGVISPDEFKGFLTGEKVKGLQWMNNKTKRGEVTAEIDSNEENKITVVVEKNKVKIKPIVGNDSVTFDIDVKMNVTVSGVEGKVTIDQIRETVAEEVKKEIEDTYEEALKHDIDIYRLSEYVYRKDVKAWKRLQKKGKVELSEDSIRNLTVKIEKVNTGRKKLRRTID